ncbi:hypothetical protein BH09BAC1_BH09BAC1_14660 [soil metagenome]
MKNPKGSYNDDALNDLLKQYMLDEAARDRTADEWLESEADAVFASEPEHVPAKEKETALIATLNEKLVTGSKGGGGLIWKGSALGLLLIGAFTAAIVLWPKAELPNATNGAEWGNEGFENANVPYYDGSDYQTKVVDTMADAIAANNTPQDSTPIKRLIVRQDNPVIVAAPDTMVAVVGKPNKPKNSTRTLLKELKRRLEAFNSQFPAERVYAQTDRTDYVPGQTLWFSAYLLNESNLKPSMISGIIKTELLNANGEPVALKEWIVTNGRVAGDIQIPQGLASGTYIFRAYTAWQHYLAGSKIFEAPIVVQQPGQTLRLQDAGIVTGTPLAMEFFPEGGDLVVGLQSRVAFTISASLAGKQGTIVDENGKVASTFASNKDGKGIFTFTPQPNKLYSARINGFNANLPAVYPDGFVLEILGQEGAWVKVNIKSTQEENVILVGQLRGEMYYGAELELQAGDNLVNIPASNLPAGVLHVSLFDADGVGHAERLVFVNKQKQLHINITTDKTNYLPRDKVTAQIIVTDDKGRPVQTTLSLSAADNLLTHTQNTNILSALLLEPDLGGVAQDAGYLFDPSNKNADKELDLLLMTHGWRRFTWKEVYYGLRQPMVSAPENAILKGKVVDAETGKPLKDVKITSKLLSIKTATAADGSFYIPNIDLSQLRELDFTYKVGIMTLVVNRYQDDLVLAFKGDARKVYQPQANSRQHPALTVKEKPTKGGAIAGQVLNAYGNGIAGANVTITAEDGTVQQLKADTKGYYIAQTSKGSNYKISVHAAGYNPYQNPSVKTQANQFSMLDVLLNYQVDGNALSAHFAAHEADTFANRYVFLAGKYEPVYNNPIEESNKNPLVNEVRAPLRDGVTAYYVEGMKMRYNEPLMLPLSAIGHMDLFDNGLPSKYNDSNGTVIEVTTGVGNSLSGTPKAPEDRPTGFNIRYAQPREYFKTQYGIRDKADSRTDLRSTLHWNGNITTDGNGKATVEFYASDDLSAFRLIVEGMGSNGVPGRIEQVVGMTWPFNLQVQMPEVLKKGERIHVPIWVENFTGKQITGNFDFTLPAGLKPIWPLAPKEHGLFPQRNDTIEVQFEVIDPTAVGTLIIGYTASGYRDVYTYVLPPVRKKE